MVGSRTKLGAIILTLAISILILVLLSYVRSVQ